MSIEDAKTERIIELLDERWSLKLQCRMWKVCFFVAALTALFVLVVYFFTALKVFPTSP